MPRLAQVPRDEAVPLVRDYYARVFGDRCPVANPGTASGTPGNWWTTYALSPPVFRHAVDHFAMSGILVDDAPSTTLDPKVRELAVLRTGWLVESRFVFSQHSKAARRVGIDAARIESIQTWESSDAFLAEDRAVLAYVDALVLRGGRVSDEGVAALRTHLDDRSILELSHHVMMYVGYGAISRALRLELDDVGDRIDEQPAP